MLEDVNAHDDYDYVEDHFEEDDDLDDDDDDLDDDDLADDGCPQCGDYTCSCGDETDNYCEECLRYPCACNPDPKPKEKKMAAVKTVPAKKAATKKVVAPKSPLENTALAVMKAHHLSYADGRFEANANPLRFYSQSNSLTGSCAVIEIRNFEPLPVDQYTPAELIELFKFKVAKTLSGNNRKQAIATTVQMQTAEYAPLFTAAGFVSLGAAKNPGSGNTVTIWALSI